MKGYIALEDGTILEGQGRVSGRSSGEIVFTTAYSGYEESLTDPSYEEQILTFAYPLIGNYGVRPERFESDRIHPRACVARQFTRDVVDWFRSDKTIAIDDVDTRELVLAIREQGAMKCGIAAGPDATEDDARAELDACVEMSDHTEIGAKVSCSEPNVYEPYQTEDGPTVALLDCGVKKSIINSFLERGATVHRLPYDSSVALIEGLDPDLFFISNGPGDPATYNQAERLVEEFTGELPIAGICLGQQVVARALGGDTEKLPFGHRGVNQPVLDLESRQVVITTQNHGYSVGDTGRLCVTQINVNDESCEGLVNEELNIITRQYHPEANPGPQDTLDFFDTILTMASKPEAIPPGRT